MTDNRPSTDGEVPEVTNHPTTMPSNTQKQKYHPTRSIIKCSGLRAGSRRARRVFVGWQLNLNLHQNTISCVSGGAPERRLGKQTHTRSFIYKNTFGKRSTSSSSAPNHWLTFVRLLPGGLPYWISEKLYWRRRRRRINKLFNRTRVRISWPYWLEFDVNKHQHATKHRRNGIILQRRTGTARTTGCQMRMIDSENVDIYSLSNNAPLTHSRVRNTYRSLINHHHQQLESRTAQWPPIKTTLCRANLWAANT